MRHYSVSIKDVPLLTSEQETWIRGENVLVSPTQIRPDEVAKMVDCQLVEDGKIQCPRDGQAYYGATSGSRVRGVFPFYKSDGTRQLTRMVGTTLQLYASASSWTNITGFSYTNDLNTNGVLAHDHLYLCNGTDALTYYDGSTITSFTAVGVANTPTVTRTGTNGSYTYSYKITAVTTVGESIASAAGTQTHSVQTLTTTDFMSLSWSATTSAVGYNVYGRKDGQWYFLAYQDGNANTTYVDKGQDTPITYLSAADRTGDQTAGPKGKYIEVYHGSLFIAGDPSAPSTITFSGGVDQIHNFTADAGGGSINVGQNDGTVITGLKVFKNTLIIFKEDSIYQFTFGTDGAPQLVLVNGAVGCIAPRSIVTVENDVFFLSRRGVFTIGNEQGFAFDVLRTNELSSRVRSLVQAIDPAYVQNAAALYTSDANKNLYILSYTPSGSTTNSKALVYDRERLGWYEWTNIQANCWATYRATDGMTHFLYGDDSSGYVKEFGSGSNDFGSGIHGYFYLKGESFKAGIAVYKTLKDIDLVLRRPSGSISLSVVKDGVTTAYTASIGTTSPSINFAHYVFNRFLFKTSSGTGVSSADELLKRALHNLNLVDGKTYQLRFDNNSGASFVLLYAKMTAKVKSARYSPSNDFVST